MRKIIPYISLFCLTGLTSTSNLSVMAGGCSSQMNQKAEIKCDEDDNECKNEKDEKFELNKTARS